MTRRPDIDAFKTVNQSHSLRLIEQFETTVAKQTHTFLNTTCSDASADVFHELQECHFHHYREQYLYATRVYFYIISFQTANNNNNNNNNNKNDYSAQNDIISLRALLNHIAGFAPGIRITVKSRRDSKHV